MTSWQTDNPCFIVSLEDKDETGQILVSFIGYISNVFLVQFWRLETSSRRFYEFENMLKSNFQLPELSKQKCFI